jgi:hypothetical protein
MKLKLSNERLRSSSLPVLERLVGLCKDQADRDRVVDAWRYVHDRAHEMAEDLERLVNKQEADQRDVRY